MSTRPSNKSFLNWCGSDQNKLKFENALRTYPDFANVKNEVFLLNDILVARIIYLFIYKIINCNLCDKNYSCLFKFWL